MRGGRGGRGEEEGGDRERAVVTITCQVGLNFMSLYPS